MIALIRNTILFASFILLMSCAGSKSYVNYEILEPAAITYPDYVEKVGYLNRAPFSLYNFSESNRRGLDQTGLYIVDTIVCNSLIRGFLEGRQSEEIPFLEELLFFNFRKTDTLAYSEEIDDSTKSVVFEKYDLDALITLDYYKMSMDKHEFRSRDYFFLVNEYELNLEVLWRVYDRDGLLPLDRFKIRDTLYFSDPISPVAGIITPTSVLKSGCEDFGYIFGQRNIPVWNEVSRVVFRTGDRKMRKAAQYTDEGDWLSAINIWTELENSEDKKIAAKAMHNLAVFYEIEDKLIIAGNYAARAEELWGNSFIKAYRKNLDERILDKEDLMNQLRINY
jgi:hypothetical protein